MAHANIFQKLNKKAQKPAREEAHYDDTTLETIKVLGEQILSLREIIEEQHLVIEDLASTVSHLKVSQKETNQNLNLAYIDQKDLAKQLRILRSNLQANQFLQKKERAQTSNPKQEHDHEIEELFFSNAKQSPVMKNAAANDAIKKTLEELKKLEKPKQKFLARKAQEEQLRQNSRPAAAIKTESRQATMRPQTIRQSTMQAQARPQAAKPNQMQEQARPQAKQTQSTKRFANEDLARKIIFGKTSKLIK
jgi:Tfp pilus tip-associated adhesin PilY1